MSAYQRDIITYLDSKQIGKALNGYRYLFDAIRIGLDDKKKLKSISKIYCILADEYCSSMNSIERGIGYALAEIETSNKSFIVNAVLDIDSYYDDNIIDTSRKQ